MKERFLIANLLNCKNQIHHKSSVKEVSTTSNVKEAAHNYKQLKKKHKVCNIYYKKKNYHSLAINSETWNSVI